jgi:hypothetical protein
MRMREHRRGAVGRERRKSGGGNVEEEERLLVLFDVELFPVPLVASSSSSQLLPCPVDTVR